ncbi:MAG: hypothetical protein K8T90_13200 [Planctomycetes bacterium]|nr:hypothetical protein [Planctomycetota bacterium]
MAKEQSEFLPLERAIAPFAEGFSVRSGNDGFLSGVYLHRSGGPRKPEIGVFAGLLLDATPFPHLTRVHAPEAIVQAYVKPVKSAVRKSLVHGEESFFQVAYTTLNPIASPEPFEFFEKEPFALVRRRRLPEGADSLMDRRLLEFCRGSLALLGQAGLLDALRQFDFAAV